MKDKLQTFADLVHNDTVDVIRKRCPSLDAEHEARVSIRPGKKYAKVDVGSSGKYMVVIATGEIFGIRAYGVIHKGKKYGNLDTIRNYYWGEYTPIKRLENITIDEVGSFEEEIGI